MNDDQDVDGPGGPQGRNGTVVTMPAGAPLKAVAPDPPLGAEPGQDNAGDPDEASVRTALVHLRQEHSDLDAAISALSEMTVPDQLAIQRLKKKKLKLKDRIGTLEDRLLPDIIA